MAQKRWSMAARSSRALKDVMTLASQLMTGPLTGFRSSDALERFQGQQGPWDTTSFPSTNSLSVLLPRTKRDRAGHSAIGGIIRLPDGSVALQMAGYWPAPVCALPRRRGGAHHRVLLWAKFRLAQSKLSQALKSLNLGQPACLTNTYLANDQVAQQSLKTALVTGEHGLALRVPAHKVSPIRKVCTPRPAFPRPVR